LVLTQSTKKVRDPLAFGLLAATALYLVASLALLFKSDAEFTDKAALFSGHFLDPVWGLVVVGAVALVTAGEASAQARLVTMVALAVLGVQLALGVVTWLVGLGADSGGGNGFSDLFGGEIGVGKVTGSFIALASLAVLAIAALVVAHVLRSLPAPVRQQQQQWGGHDPQQQWGQQPQQWGSQSGQQPGQQAGQQHGQWGAPGAGTAAGGVAGATAWGQPEQQQWGQPEQQQWGQPEQQDDVPPTAEAGQPWGQPQQPAADPEATQYYGSAPEPTTEGTAAPEAQPSRSSDTGTDDRTDDQRPGWWAPGS